MIITGIILLLCAVAIASVTWIALRTPTIIKAGDDLSKHLVPVNLPAFLNLIDSGQKEFLRQNLPAAEFRSLARQRSRIALSYTKKISHNTAVLTRWAELARISAPDAATAEQAASMATLGVWTRMHVLAAMMLLYADYVFPGIAELKDVAARYEILTVRQMDVAAERARR